MRLAVRSGVPDTQIPKVKIKKKKLKQENIKDPKNERKRLTNTKNFGNCQEAGLSAQKADSKPLVSGIFGSLIV